MSDRIALIHRGRIEQIGEVHEIYHRPATAFAAEFIGHSNLLDVELLDRAHGAVLLRLGGGLTLQLPERTWTTTGTRARVSIRPEKIHVSKTSITGENCFEARVEDEVFKGASDRLVLATSSGTRLTAVVPNESALLAAVHAGDHVWCAVHSDDIVVIS
jgi:spermidine/putrescine transport system ATP-binding protein